MACRDRRTAAGGAESLRRSIVTTRISNESDLADMSTYRVTAKEMRRRLTTSPADIAECDSRTTRDGNASRLRFTASTRKS
jgi:hypothetical protein